MYNEIIRDHFFNPRNVGSIEQPDGEGWAKNAQDGDITHIWLTIKDDVITEIRFKALGCVVAIAASSMLTEKVKGKTLEEAQALRKEELAEALGGLPPQKIGCSLTCLEALRNAIDDYRSKRAK